MMTLVFVYGTLKRGNGNHRRLASASFLGEAITEQPFLMRDSGFPVVLQPPATQEGRREKRPGRCDYCGRPLTTHKSLKAGVGPICAMAGNIAPVKGEVFKVDAETLKDLDCLEGEGCMYQRTHVQVIMDGNSITVFMYIGVESFWKVRHTRSVALAADGIFDWQ